MFLESFNQIIFVSNYFIIMKQSDIILRMTTFVRQKGLNIFPECFIINNFVYDYATKVRPHAFSSK